MTSWQTVEQISHVTKKPFIGDNCEPKAQQWCPLILRLYTRVVGLAISVATSSVNIITTSKGILVY